MKNSHLFSTHFLVALAAVSIIPSTHAVICHYTDFPFGSREWKTCEGDFCTISGSNDRLDQASFGCINGSSFSYLNDKCWVETSETHCVCDTDFCTDNSTLPISNGTSGVLKCGRSENCTACTAIVNDEGVIVEESCKNSGYILSGIPFFPQSCVRMQFGGMGEYATCICNTSDHCASKLASEQTLRSELVTCYSDENMTTTCKGDLCIIGQRPGYPDLLMRYCLTNNETLFPGLVQPFFLKSKYAPETIFCNSSFCNADMEIALNSLQGTSKTTSVTINTTSPVSREVQFESAYIRFFTNIKAALDSFMMKFAELYG